MAISSTSYQPGETGNPHGRPKKGYSITEAFREMFDSDPELKRRLAQKVLDKALEGDMAACKVIWSYMDGLPMRSAPNSTEAESHLLVLDLP